VGRVGIPGNLRGCQCNAVAAGCPCRYLPVTYLCVLGGGVSQFLCSVLGASRAELAVGVRRSLNLAYMYLSMYVDAKQMSVSEAKFYAPAYGGFLFIHYPILIVASLTH